MKANVRVIEERCKGCRICIEVCQAEVLGTSDAANRAGHHPPCILNMDACTFCGLCEMLCPDFAIFVTPEESEVDSK
jgi:2-oxoglutarate ferredoxin oxidoreductase subunit delta